MYTVCTAPKRRMPPVVVLFRRFNLHDRVFNHWNQHTSYFPLLKWIRFKSLFANKRSLWIPVVPIVQVNLYLPTAPYKSQSFIRPQRLIEYWLLICERFVFRRLVTLHWGRLALTQPSSLNPPTSILPSPQPIIHSTLHLPPPLHWTHS